VAKKNTCQKRILGHPDEIKATTVSLGRQMNTDKHGLKIFGISPSAKGKTLSVQIRSIRVQKTLNNRIKSKEFLFLTEKST